METENVNDLFSKHLRLLVFELFLCWSESKSQFLCVSMSKRGYNSKSRYNPNSISSFLIKIIKFLEKKEIHRILSSQLLIPEQIKVGYQELEQTQSLIYQFQAEKINSLEVQNFNHLKREFVLIYDKGKLCEYTDTYETNEIGQVLKYYNRLISKNLFDIPDQHEEFLTRTDKRKIVISNFSSCSYSYNANDQINIMIDGCWWNKLDFNLSAKIRDKLIINHQKTSHFSFYNFFGEYLTKISNTNVILKPKTFASILNFEQLCYLTLKYFRSSNKKSFVKSVLIEKKKLNLHKFSNDEIKNAVVNNITDNRAFEPFASRKVEVKWDEFLSKSFFLSN